MRMKAKMRVNDLSPGYLATLNRVAAEYIDAQIASYLAKLKYKLARRVCAAVCLHLNDIYGFGQVRCHRAVEALGEILNGVTEDVYVRGEVDPEGQDKLLDSMIAELHERGVEMVIQGDPIYGKTKSCEDSAET